MSLISQNITELLESPVLMLPGVDDSFNILVAGSGTLANVTMALYRDGTDVSATNLSGSTSVSGRVITTKTLTSLVGGSAYRFYVYYTDDGASACMECMVYVPKLGVSPSKYPIAFNKLRTIESPLTIYPGQSVTYTLSVNGEGTLASPTMYVYKGTSDNSSTALSGSLSITGRLITLKTIGSLSGGSEYIAYVYFTDGGKSTVRYFEIVCPKLGVW